MAQMVLNETVTGLGAALSSQKTIVDSQGIIVTETIPATVTEHPIPNFMADVSEMSAVAFLAVGGDLTVRTNAVSPGHDDEFTLTAGQLLVWDGNGTNPIGSADVTGGLFVDNANAAAVTLEIRMLQDTTP